MGDVMKARRRRIVPRPRVKCGKLALAPVSSAVLPPDQMTSSLVVDPAAKWQAAWLPPGGDCGMPVEMIAAMCRD